MMAAWALPDAYSLIKGIGLMEDPEAFFHKPEISFAWFYPINTIITVVFGLLIPGSNTEDGKEDGIDEKLRALEE